MMSVPAPFQWSDIPFDELNKLPIKEKEAFLKKEEMNIRQNLGEAVPTIIFRQIAHKISKVSCRINMTEQDIKDLIERKHLDSQINLVDFINKSNKIPFLRTIKNCRISKC